MINADTILNSIKEAVEAKRQLNPDIWLDAAFKLNVLIGDENDVLLTHQQEVAKKKLEFLTAGDTVAAAKLKVEATDEHKEMMRQRVKSVEVNPEGLKKLAEMKKSLDLSMPQNENQED